MRTAVDTRKKFTATAGADTAEEHFLIGNNGHNAAQRLFSIPAGKKVLNALLTVQNTIPECQKSMQLALVNS
jgi:hypothetical protein